MSKRYVREDPPSTYRNHSKEEPKKRVIIAPSVEERVLQRKILQAVPKGAYVLKMDLRKYFYNERSYKKFMDSRVAELNKENAKYYGYEAQSNQLVEECAELIQAISKYRRAGYGVVGTPVTLTAQKQEVALENLVEEIADVEIMLEQIKYLLHITEEDLDAVKIYKVNRTREKRLGK